MFLFRKFCSAFFKGLFEDIDLSLPFAPPRYKHLPMHPRVLPCPFFFRSIAPRRDRTSTEWGTTEVRIGSVPDSRQTCKDISQEAVWRYGGRATLKRRGKSFFNFPPRGGMPECATFVLTNF